MGSQRISFIFCDPTRKKVKLVRCPNYDRAQRNISLWWAEMEKIQAENHAVCQTKCADPDSIDCELCIAGLIECNTNRRIPLIRNALKKCMKAYSEMKRLVSTCWHNTNSTLTARCNRWKCIYDDHHDRLNDMGYESTNIDDMDCEIYDKAVNKMLIWYLKCKDCSLDNDGKYDCSGVSE
ncbi:uncharacterized protein LOC141911044 isoform X2 [Tubulanus polymorphus]|uniref:uncharacterized protein LOC141911044 isoform X2 n=1 Tax=Tubulanus polymorphus TaxID=672921 RepID=UPI003DA41423